MNPTLLDEWAAWCECAMLCEDRELIGGICWVLRCGDHLELCKDRLWRHEPKRHAAYWWPHTREGWNARAAFCWRMAEECEREGATDA